MATRRSRGGNRAPPIPAENGFEVFGQALNLSPAEIHGLLRLAGLDPDGTYTIEQKQRLAESAISTPGMSGAPTQHDGTESGPDLSLDSSKSYVSEWLKFALSRSLLLGSFIVVAGFLLSWFGWDATWMVMVYVFVSIGLVLVKTLMKMVPSSDLRDPYFASVFILLNIPLLQARSSAWTRMVSSLSEALPILRCHTSCPCLRT